MATKHHWSNAVPLILACLIPVITFQACGEGFALKSEFADLASTSGDLPPTTTEPAITLEGKALYTQNCAACHGSFASSTKAGRTFANIKLGIKDIPSMAAALKNVSDKELQLIADALNLGAVQTGGANPFVCSTEQDPATTDLRRLSRREYLNTLETLLANYVTLAQLQTQIDQLPSDTVSATFDTVDNSVSASHTEAYLAIAKNASLLLSSQTPWMNSVLNCSHATNGMTNTCWQNFFDGFAMQVFRRPLTEQEKTDYKLIYTNNSGGSIAQGIQVVVQTLLQSPHFTYKVETAGTAVAGNSTLYKVNDFELASRLAFFATGEGPSLDLLQKASQGTLNTSAGYTAVVNSLFASDKSKKHIREFYTQWLGLNRLPPPNQTSWFMGIVPKETIRSEAAQEIHDFMNYYIWKTPGTYRDLLLSEKSFVRGPSLASIYGSRAITENTDENLPTGERPGVMSRVGMLLSGTNQASLVHRGLVVRKNLLCDNIPNPVIADNEKNLFLPPVSDPLSSMRSQIETRTNSTRCLACHSIINPSGFVLENYDALGRYRSQELVYDSAGTVLARHNVDAKVTPNIEGSMEPAVDGLKQFALSLSKSSKGPACMTQQWFTYSMGREPAMADGCSLSRLYQSLQDTQFQSASGDTAATIFNMLKAAAFDSQFKLRKHGPIQ